LPEYVGRPTSNPNDRFAIVAARFNGFVVDSLVGGARDGLLRHGVAESAIDVVRVPGSLELPIVVKRLASSGRYAAVIAVGAVIRGDTSHYDVVVGESAGKLSQIAYDTGVPVLNAVLTTENLEQAIERAGGKAGNKGYDAACAALEMADLLDRLPGASS
jgi:6,7-dimethyl-8-ribityllumazine synthase